jgi:hypothetical protein
VFTAGESTTPFPFSGVEQIRFEGLAGDDAYAVSALPVPLTVDDKAGNDTVDSSGATGGVGATVSLAVSSAQKVFGGTTTLTLKGVIENATGTPYADKITGSSAVNVLRGMAGDDTIFGGAGNDTIYGGDGNDWLYGEAGNDSLYGDLGNNVLLGGDGNDLLNVDSDVVTTPTRRNLLIGGKGLDTLRGGAGEEILIGGTTAYDGKTAALVAIMQEWTRDISFTERRTHLRTDGIPDPTNSKNTIRLTPKTKADPKGTVLDDSAVDQFFGVADDDWAFPFGTENAG